MQNLEIQITATKTAKLVKTALSTTRKPNQVVVKSLISLVSTGSELGPFRNLEGDMGYPIKPGYTVIGRIVKAADDALIGQTVLTDYPHAAYGVVPYADCTVLPADTPIEKTIFARLAAVSMSSIVDTKVKPFEPVLVLGLGMVGGLACQILAHLGYQVSAIDQNAQRRATLADFDQVTTFDSVLALQEASDKPFGLMLECTGNDALLLEALPLMRKRSDVYQIGVPWKEYSDQTVHDLLRAIFYGFINLKSGWEWFLPDHASEYDWYGHTDNMRRAAEWIKSGVLSVDSQYQLYSPADCQQAYQALSDRTETHSVIFDWRQIDIRQEA